MRLFLFVLWTVLTAGLSAGTLEFTGNTAYWELQEGREFPGAAGTLTSSTDGTLRLSGDFHGGGRYVAARTAVALPPCRAIRFKVRGSTRGFSLRVVDSAGQTHQYLHPLPANSGEWTPFEFKAGTESKAHWGGADDGIFRGAPRSAALILGDRELDRKTGMLEFRDFELCGTDATLIPQAVPEAARYFVSPDTGWFELDVIAAAPDDAGTKFRLKDYAGAEIASGLAKVDAKTRKLKIPLPRRPGFFEIELSECGLTVGVVASTPFSGEQDDYFGIDFSSSRCHLSEAEIRGMMRMLTRGGIFWCRDRLGWGELNPQPGTIDFAARDGRYEMLRRTAAEEGIRILDVTHDAPAWNKKLRSKKDDFLAGANTGKYSPGSNVYPRDLIAGAEAWSRILAHWRVIGAFEVWNEPDIRFGNDFPPEYVAALTRAVSLQLSIDRVPTAVVGGCLAHPNPMLYGMLIRNGVPENSDTLSFHTYETVTAQEPLVAGLRRVESELTPEQAGFPYWVTESGMPWPSGTDRPSAEADRESAREIAGKAFEFRALGIRKYFPFLIKYYTEPKRNFGMLDRNMTPLRSIAAYLHLVAELAGTEYAGDLKLPGVIRARVFAGPKRSVGCLYTDGGEFHLPAGLRPTAIRGADGRPLQENDGRVILPDGIGYLEFAGKVPDRFLDRNVPAVKLYANAKAWKPQERSRKMLVIQPDFDMTALEYSNEGYILEAGERFELRVVLNNFSDRPLTAEPVLELPPGCRESEPGSDKVELPPRSRREYLRCFTVDETLPVDHFSLVTLKDRNNAGTPLVLAVRKSKAETLNVFPGKGDWIELPAGSRKGTGSCDISAKFRVGYSAGRIRLEVRVKDPRHFCDLPPGRLWNGDSVQFAFARPRPGNSSKEFLNLDLTELTAAATPAGNRVEIRVPMKKQPMAGEIGFQFRRTQDENSEYVLEVPAALLDATGFQAGTELRFSLLVNSNDGTGRCGYLTWGGGIGDEKSPTRFNRLYFR